MITFPNAKINIGLNIVEKKPDGYHNLESCFYPIPWCDILEIIPSEKLQFTSDGISIPGGGENLCLQAYQLLKKDFDISPVHIHLHKLIPIGAGLGGGSADCAFTIKMLNELFELKLTVKEMESYAGKLGADCPFFIQNKPKYVEGIGDVLTDIELDLAGYWLAVVYPGIHVSTQAAYANVTPSMPEHNLKSQLAEPIESWTLVKNDFEKSVFPVFHGIELVKRDLIARGAMYASMTGSGSAVFGLFKEEPISFENRWLLD